MGRQLSSAHVSHFGKFLEKLLEDLGIKFVEARKGMDVSEKTLWNWRAREDVPNGPALTKITDYLVIDEDVFRAAAEGAKDLDAEFRDRNKWLERRASLSGKPALRSAAKELGK